MSDLSADKRRLLEQRLGRRPAARPAAPVPIPPRSPGPPPLSPGQAALLYEHRLRPDGAIYNVVFRYDIRGPLDVERLEAAIAAVVARHEPLHTSAAPIRRTLPVSDALLTRRLIVDHQRFDDAANHEARERFDLDNGPLVRVTTAILGEDHHGLIFALHHLSADAVSFSRLWREIDLHYHGEALPQLEATYSAHAEWQATRVSESDREFWRDHLGGDAEPVDLPLERPAPIESDGYMTISTDVQTASMQEVGLQPTSFFLGVFAALLQRYTDTDDVVVGVTASTRDHPDVQNLIGYFLTLLPLRLTIDPAQSSVETGRSTEATLGSALRHRHVPYASIASDRRLAGAESPDPARVMFVYDEPQSPRLRGLDIVGSIVHPGVSVTDLTMFVRPVESRFEISFEWSGARYRRSDIERLSIEFVRMAEWAIGHPGSPWSSFPHDSDIEGPALVSPLRPIPELIADHVARRPDAPAVRSADRRLTYRQLWERSGEIAAGLIDQGVPRGGRVAVVLPRGVEIVATILGIQRAGAAYVPIDPGYPAERIRLILEAANVDAVVTDHSIRPLIDQPSLLVDDLTGALRGHPPVELDDGAYVIFTSGSTGVPRGIPVDHRRLSASTLARLEWYDDPVETFLLPSSFGFDSSIAGLHWTLATGGELVVPSDDEVHDIDAMASLAAEARVSHTLMVPGLYRALLTRDPGALRSLRCAIVAGEACPAALVDLHHAHLPEALMVNEYGPAEATVWATAHRCSVGDSPVPIGLPIPGVRVRIVDRWLRPRPTGAIGQLAIGGNGVTDGYLGQPSISSEKFVSTRPGGARLYLTGDRVRLDDAGRLCFVGRTDHQLSFGGVRIEPEEIEAALLAIPDVRGALVRVEKQLDVDPLEALRSLGEERSSEILRVASESEEPADELSNQLAEHAAGSSVLVAYVEGVDLEAGELREQLMRTLPKAILPTFIDIVARLERTEHDKIDRSALPPPLRQPAALRNGSSSTDLTDRITQAFRIVLRRSEVDHQTDFFEAGGDSLAAVELVSTLEDDLGRRIPISALVLGRTPRQLAALIDVPRVDSTATNASRSSHIVPLKSGDDQPPLLIMPPAGGNLIAFDQLVRAMPDRMPILGFDLPGADRDQDLPTSVEDLCETYLPQLRAAAPTGPYRFLGWSFGGVVALELARRLEAEGEDIELVVMIDTLVPGYQRAGRMRVYTEMARARDVAGILSLVALRIRNRLRIRATAKLGAAALDNGTEMAPQDRDLWLTMRIDEIVERHRARPYAGRVLYFAAQDTFAWRSTEPWSELLEDFEVIALEGSHNGAEGLLSGERVVRIADEIANRLG